MKTIKLKITAICLAIGGLMASVTSGQANVIDGSLWAVPELVSQNAIPANIPGVAPDVTFEVNSPFNFSGTSVSVGTWLGSSGAFNINDFGIPAALTRLMDDGNLGTLIEFTGFVTVTNGQNFTVTHDDGLTLIIGGLDLGFNAGPTAPTTSIATYTGPSGNFPFQLVYTECCGGPAVLQVDLPFSNVPVPEPGTLALFGFALAGLALARRRRQG